MSKSATIQSGSTVFGLSEWEQWLDHMAGRLFRLSGAEFEAEFSSGRLGDSGAAADLGSMLPIIRKLRQGVTDYHAT